MIKCFPPFSKVFEALDMDGRDVAASRNRANSLAGGHGDEDDSVGFGQETPNLWDYDAWAAAKGSRRGGSGPPILPPHLLQVCN